MNNIINSVDPWSPLIFKSKFNGDLSHIKTKIDSIFLNKKLNNKNTVSSYEYNINALLWEEFKEFLPFLNNNINYCSSQWKYSYKQYFIQNSWFVNIHNGGYVNSHIHRGAQISIIFCIDNTEFGSKITVKNPLQYHWSSAFNIEAETMELENKDHEIIMKSGDVLIIPPWMYHGTSINTSNIPSCFMALNVGGD
jgi:hypothetical protein